MSNIEHSIDQRRNWRSYKFSTDYFQWRHNHSTCNNANRWQDYQQQTAVHTSECNVWQHDTYNYGGSGSPGWSQNSSPRTFTNWSWSGISSSCTLCYFYQLVVPCCFNDCGSCCVLDHVVDYKINESNSKQKEEKHFCMEIMELMKSLEYVKVIFLPLLVSSCPVKTPLQSYITILRQQLAPQRKETMCDNADVANFFSVQNTDANQNLIEDMVVGLEEELKRLLISSGCICIWMGVILDVLNIKTILLMTAFYI